MRSDLVRRIDGSDLPCPAQVARELSHLAHLVFLDSSSSENSENPKPYDRFSIITALPKTVHTGNLFVGADAQRLVSLYESKRRSDKESPDLGFPTDGLYGYVTYEGDFVFGEYDKVLLFDHRRQEWLAKGSLWDQRKRTTHSKSLPLAFAQGVTKAQFCDMVARAQDYIAAGDIYQVNLSHRFTAELRSDFDALSFYERLRERSPSPYAAYLNLGNREIMSSSPEQFLSISGRTIQTRPIKGTRPRFRDQEQDEKSAYDLLTSPKEVAELIMITDLERNDLGQICEFGSVTASELLKLERYAQVFHLVSTVQGTLRREVSAPEALISCLPGGSITGAPKKRAREIIEELEPAPRGLYTGTIGCLGFNGECRFNIAIRTAIREGEQLHFHVGAGIVADSEPEKEWNETLHKAAGILQAGTAF